MIPDQPQRIEALDPAQSFIVQAPAGSGKTELLTQRFLKLLAYVHRPEEILAITFTKKAVHEMRERILKALQLAEAGIEPDTEHGKTTFQLAKAVLKQNNQKQWALLENPNRLRIQTIDAFCMSLNQQLPILAGFGASPEINQLPEPLYIKAIQNCLLELEENTSRTDAIKQLLRHLDNNTHIVEQLLLRMLKSRDQWLPHLFDETRLQRNALEQAFQTIILDTLNQLTLKINGQDKSCLSDALNFAREYAPENSQISQTQDFTLSASLDHINAWQSVCELLLTKDGNWRKTFNARLGLISSSTDKSAVVISKQHKANLKALIDSYQDNDALFTLLNQVKLLPKPHYTEQQWQLISALITLLPAACAHLNLIFSEHGQIDYIENALAALKALGSDTEPTDLALALDNKISHILIDEFQDTSITQLHLLEKLTGTWQPNDGRTLFVVGDPMQSIYLFRQANVSIFMQLKQQGINQIRLKSLVLSSNFRSSKTLVDWMNHIFKQTFPTQENINTGAVSFSAATAIKTATSQIVCENCIDQTLEAARIIDIIQTALSQDPQQSIAILIRAKSHCAQILPALRAAKIDYQAVDIDPLITRSSIMDCLMLTRALLHPFDKTAWLAVLRAPFCGLNLADLLILSKRSTIAEALTQDINQLSQDGQQRCRYILPVVTAQLANRNRAPLGDWIQHTWQLLKADLIYTSDNDRQDSLVFFNLLNDASEGGRMIDWPTFYLKLKQLFATTESNATANIQIMTMHKAKGLEFDTVILPSLQAAPAPNQSQLLLWHERMISTTQQDLLLAPIKDSSAQTEASYQFLRRLESEKQQHELCRLLYVACTRAKRHLYCLACLPHDEQTQAVQAPNSRSLLNCFWQPLKAHFEETTTVKTIGSDHPSQTLKRACITHFSNPPQVEITNHQQHNPNYHWQAKSQQYIGICLHDLLQQLAENGKTWWQTLAQEDYLSIKLKQLGIASNALDAAINTIKTAIENTLNNPQGLWIINAKTQAYCEYEISGNINQEIVTGIIDRTFIDNNIRWIIDYKTVFSDIDNFEQHSEQYLKQLERYQHLMQPLSHHDIKLGIYYPLQAKFIELSNVPITL